MKKPLSILFAIVAVTSNSAPAHSQQLTLDQMTRMAGGNQSYLPALQAQYDTRGFQVSARNSNSAAVAGYGFVDGSSGDSGDFGNSSSGSYNLANDGDSVSNYYGQTANQRPYSGGGLPETTTAVQSLEGGFGKTFGRTSFPSGSFTYGFANNRQIPYRGVSGNRTVQGRNLPRVSTASVDIDIVDKGRARGAWQRRVYIPTYEALLAIRRANARGSLPRGFGK